MTGLLESKTYHPSDDARVDRMDDLLNQDAPATFALISGDEQIPLPDEVNAILAQVVSAMRAGKAITVTPQSQSLTTQQAADLLGVSRPTLIKFIDAGELPCTRPSNRRMLLLDDVMTFRRKRREQQLASIAATQAEFEDDTDPETMKKYLAEARAARLARKQQN